MDVEISFTVSRPETTDAVTRGAARLFVALGYAPLAEVVLPNGRRADIMALGPRGAQAAVPFAILQVSLGCGFGLAVSACLCVLLLAAGVATPLAAVAVLRLRLR